LKGYNGEKGGKKLLPLITQFTNANRRLLTREKRVLGGGKREDKTLKALKKLKNKSDSPLTQKTRGPGCRNICQVSKRKKNRRGQRKLTPPQNQ